jgi:protease-4
MMAGPETVARAATVASVLPMKPSILMLVLMSLSGAAVAEVEHAATRVEQPAGQADGTLILALSGSLPLRPGGGFLLGDSGMSLFDATAHLKRALQEPEKRLVLDCSLEFHPGLTAAEELAALLRTRPAGKTVVCLIDNASDAVMAMAAACDEVVMVEAGMLNLDGMALSSDYYGDALNRFGIKFHAITSGPAKTAPEPFTSGRPSATAIAENQRLVDALDRATRELTTRPGVDAAVIASARAQAPQTSAIAKQLGLVTAVAEPGTWLKSQPGAVRRLRTTPALPQLKSIFELPAFLNQLFQGDEGTSHPRAVAVVELEGTIIDGDVSLPGYSIAGNDTAALFDRLAGDRSIVAVVVRINSGGGSAGASDRAYHALRRLEQVKPVVALFDAVCASGGYYIGCAAREVLVHRGTITGSIGVFAMVPDLEGARALFGIHRHTIATGPRANLFSTDAFTPEREAGIRQVVADVDRRFQGIVAERRKLDPAKVHDLAGGRVFSGDEAVANGLADRIGDLSAAVARARELAGITEPLPLQRLPRSSGLAARLGLGGMIGSTLPATLAQGLPTELRMWLTLAQEGRLQVMAWRAPFLVE